MKRILPLCQNSIMLLLFLSYMLSACKKMDSADSPVNPHPSANSFFDLPQNASSAVRKTVAEFARQDKITGFVKELVATEGMPLWDKSLIEVRKKSTVTTAGLDGGGGFEIEDTLVFTPLLEEDSLSVNAFYLSKITGDSVELHLYRGNDYDNYAYGRLNSDSLTAERIVLQLMSLNNAVFGYKEFITTDSLLFANDAPIVSDSPYFRTKVKLKEDNQHGFANSSTQNLLVTQVTVCREYYCSQLERGNNNNQGSSFMVCTVELCTTTILIGYEWPPEYPIPTTGGGGGGMGTPPANGNCTGATNCREGSILLEGRIPCGNCGPGPIFIPYICTYQLTPQEAAIFAALDAEDELADDNYETLDCEGTNRTGNVMFNGTLEHMLIQTDFASSNPTYGKVEFAIPGSSAAGNRGYADMVNTLSGNVFEIKPNNATGIANGTVEVDRYVTKGNEHCTSVLPFGVTFNKTGAFAERNYPTVIPNRYLNVKLIAPGVVGYSYITTTNQPVPAPYAAPSSILDKFKELFNRLKDNIGAFDQIIAEYLQQHPELVTYIKNAAYGAAVIIIVGTIVEDFLTVGGGVSDDVASFLLARRIVRFARALP